MLLCVSKAKIQSVTDSRRLVVEDLPDWKPFGVSLLVVLQDTSVLRLRSEVRFRCRCEICDVLLDRIG